jgi:SAM-dependent methyltransferase
MASKAAVEARHGPWTAHNARLSDSVWTIKKGVVNFDEKTRRAVQIAHDFFGPDLSHLRVLDLGAGEGGLSLEFARQGAKVVCVEGREANIAKARFVADTLGIEGITFVCDDVRHAVSYGGRFDLVLCYGLLYHLDASSALGLVASIYKLSSRVAVLDTHFSLAADETVELGGEPYTGWSFQEHAEEATVAEKLANPWSSLDNTRSFWLTKPSLLNLLSAVGFRTVYEVQGPLVYDFYDRATDVRYKFDDRATFVAVKSALARVVVSPAVNLMPLRKWPDDFAGQLIPSPGGRQRAERSPG